jgi:hypothetical protein
MLIKKVITFSAPPPIKKMHQGVARRGMYLLLFLGFGRGAAVPLIAKKILDL